MENRLYLQVVRQAAGGLVLSVLGFYAAIVFRFYGPDSGQPLWIGLFSLVLIDGMAIRFIAVMNLRSALSESMSPRNTAASSNLERAEYCHLETIRVSAGGRGERV